MSDQASRAARLKRAGRSPLDWLTGRLGGSGRLFAMLEHRLDRGSAELRLPDGRVLKFSSGKPGPQAIFEIRDWRALRRMALGGALGFARAYIDGDWDTPDLAAVTELGSLNRRSAGADLGGSRLVRGLDRLRHLLRENRRARARRNIAFHYDLGNDFYAAWLDTTMTYSSAIFGEGDNSLEAAQKRKYRRLLDMLDTRPGQHILEIGCGWGGFAEIAAGERGARVTGLTLSEEQLHFARERIARAGLSDRVTFKLQDYRDERETYNHVASIEMFEAVGERYWPDYFRTIHDVLRPGGRAALQIITIEEALFPAYRRSADFIQTWIFPGGILPGIEALRREISAAGLLWREATGFAESYARTLALWRTRFNKAFEQGRLPPGFDETFRRIWNFYLAYCEGGFRGGSVDVMQLALERP